MRRGFLPTVGVAITVAVWPAGVRQSALVSSVGACPEICAM